MTHPDDIARRHAEAAVKQLYEGYEMRQRLPKSQTTDYVIPPPARDIIEPHILAALAEQAVENDKRIAELELVERAFLMLIARVVRDNRNQGWFVSDQAIAFIEGPNERRVVKEALARLIESPTQAEASEDERCTSVRDRVHNARRDQAQAEIERLKAALSEAEAVVSRLPKTADGVPITPGMQLWTCSTSDGWYSTQVRIGTDFDSDLRRTYWLNKTESALNPPTSTSHAASETAAKDREIARLKKENNEIRNDFQCARRDLELARLRSTSVSDEWLRELAINAANNYFNSLEAKTLDDHMAAFFRHVEQQRGG